MTPLIIGVICWVILLGLLFLGIPAGVALLVVGFVGVCWISGIPQAFHIVARATYDTSMTHLYALIPLFVFMGQLASEGGLGRELYLCASKWIGGFRGGLGMTTVVTATGFAAVCGDNMAGAATMTSVCYPEMKKYGYDVNLSLATVAAGSLLSFMIPPSLGFIIYGLLVGTNISDLFLGGVVPGVIIAVLFIALVYVICRVDPTKGPALTRASWKERIAALRYVWGILLLVVIVFGGIYSGFITVTEAGALGAFAAFIVAAAKRNLSWRKLWRAVTSTAQITGMVFLLLIGAFTFAPFLSLTRIPATLVTAMAGWPPELVLVVVLVFFLVGGFFFESMILLMITIPLFLPVMTAAGFDLLWLGVVLMIIIITSGITPPVGMVVYVVSGMVPEASSGGIFRVAVWFVLPVVVCAGLVIAFPQIATALPNLMAGQ